MHKTRQRIIILSYDMGKISHVVLSLVHDSMSKKFSSCKDLYACLCLAKEVAENCTLEFGKDFCIVTACEIKCLFFPCQTLFMAWPSVLLGNC